tara:strand:+ start:3078 stop:4268 length:1191 start_codon:yes stop_codon:yes gene_type:complete
MNKDINLSRSVLMSDQELEMQAEADEILDGEVITTDESDSGLQEKAAVKKEAKVKVKAEEDEEDDSDDVEDDSDDEEEAEESKKNVKEAVALPKTKTAMINAMLGAMKGMKKDDIASNWGKINAAFGADDDEDDDSDDDEKEVVKSHVKEVKKVTKEDIDVSDDVKALFGDEDLTEEFKTSATTIFEAAVVSKINEVLETVCIDLDVEVEAEKEVMAEEISTRLDDYLEYVVEEWTKDNELAVQQGIRSEITENFMQGLRQLFTENYIDIPEEKTDLVDELASKVQELESSVNEEMEKNISLSKGLNEMKKHKILKNVSEGLSETQTEKLRSLSDGIEFIDDEDYKEKLDTVKENYFPSEEVIETGDEEPLVIEDDKPADGSMSAYTNAISRSIKK